MGLTETELTTWEPAWSAYLLQLCNLILSCGNRDCLGLTDFWYLTPNIGLLCPTLTHEEVLTAIWYAIILLILMGVFKLTKIVIDYQSDLSLKYQKIFLMPFLFLVLITHKNYTQIFRLLLTKQKTVGGNRK